MTATTESVTSTPALEELHSRDQWAGWRSEPQPGNAKPNKTPYSAVRLGMKASSTDPSTWASHERAHAYMLKAGLDGLMYGLTAEDEIVFVDLDHCRDVVTGEIEDWAQRWIDAFGSYAEISPSETGVHILVRGSLPGGRGHKRANYEMYDRVRFMTVTGSRVDGTVNRIEPAQDVIDRFLEEIFPDLRHDSGDDSIEVDRPMPDLSDDQVIERATTARNGAKFAALFSGDVSGYPSASEADAAFCVSTLAAAPRQGKTRLKRSRTIELLAELGAQGFGELRSAVELGGRILKKHDLPSPANLHGNHGLPSVDCRIDVRLAGRHQPGRGAHHRGP